MPQLRNLISSNNNIGARGEKEAQIKRITCPTEFNRVLPVTTEGKSHWDTIIRSVSSEKVANRTRHPQHQPKKRDTEKDNKALEFTRDATHWFLACLGASAHKARSTENGQRRISHSQCQQMERTRFLHRWGSVLFYNIITLRFRYIWTCSCKVHPLEIWSCFFPEIWNSRRRSPFIHIRSYLPSSFTQPPPLSISLIHIYR